LNDAEFRRRAHEWLRRDRDDATVGVAASLDERDDLIAAGAACSPPAIAFATSICCSCCGNSGPCTSPPERCCVRRLQTNFERLMRTSALGCQSPPPPRAPTLPAGHCGSAGCPGTEAKPCPRSPAWRPEPLKGPLAREIAGLPSDAAAVPCHPGCPPHWRGRPHFPPGSSEFPDGWGPWGGAETPAAPTAAPLSRELVAGLREIELLLADQLTTGLPPANRIARAQRRALELREAAGVAPSSRSA
jgi:hypothetical protein